MPPNIVEEIKDGLTEIKGGIQESKLLGEQNGAEIREMRAQLDRLRRGQLGAPKMLRNGLDEDCARYLGAFVGRYVARQMAKWEDTVGFLADGTGTYGSPAISGVGKYSDTQGKKIQLTAGNSDPTKITLANMRTLRGQINSAVLGTSAY